jgi:hypothetical protein
MEGQINRWTRPIYKWTGQLVPFGSNEELNNKYRNLGGLPHGKGMLEENGGLIYVGNMEAGKRHDNKAWALMENISEEYPGAVGVVGRFYNDMIMGPCNMYPNPNDPSSKVSGIMEGGGRFYKPMYQGSGLFITQYCKIGTQHT